jgi:hypothetical protein
VRAIRAGLALLSGARAGSGRADSDYTGRRHRKVISGPALPASAVGHGVEGAMSAKQDACLC